MRPPHNKSLKTNIDISEKEIQSGIISLHDNLENITQGAENDYSRESFCQSIFENKLHGFVLCKMIHNNGQLTDHIYVAANNEFETMTDTKDIIGKNTSDVLPHLFNLNPQFTKTLNNVKLSGKTGKYITFMASLKKWFLISLCSPFEEHFVCLVDDITLAKQAAEEIQITLKELSIYKKAIDEASIISITDEKGGIKHVNDNFCKISKFTTNEVLCQDHRIINSGYHPDVFFKNLWEIITNGNIWKGELKNKTKDGSIYWVDATIIPFLDEQGKPYQYLSIGTDISNRKKLEEQQMLFASIVNSSDDAIISKTLEGIITSWNNGAKKVFGYSAEEIIGKHISILIPTHLQNDEKNLIDKIRDGHVVDHYETERIKKDGELIRVSLTISPIKDISGNIIGASKIAHNITNSTKSKEIIASANKEKVIVLNRISDSVVSVDNGWRYTFLNDAALSTHPSGKDNTIGKVIWDVHPEMKGTVFWDKYHEAMLTHKVVEFENYYPPMDIWFSVKVYPSLDGLTIFYKDVTNDKKAELKLSQTLKEVTDYKFALDQASIVAITDQKGVIKYVNDNFCKISKYSKEELIGQDHRIINSGYHPKEFIRDLWVTIANGKIWKGALKNKAKDGTIYWVDTTIVPFLDAVGKPYQYVAIRADITERKIAEERLIKSEKIYKTIASSIPGCVICLLDQDFRYMLIEGDMVEKLGYSRDKLLGNKAQDVLPPEIFAEFSSEFNRAFNREEVTLESSRYGYDTFSKFVPLINDNNSVYAIMVATIDVTQLKEAERNISELNKGLEEKIAKRTLQLEMVNNELESFSYSVSHDLRAPLRIIDGFGQILLEDYFDQLDGEGRHTIEVIMNSARKMGQLIDDLLRFSKLGRSDLRTSKVDMNELADEVLQELKSTGLTIPANLTRKKLRMATGDRSLLKQVWINLISNAIKYSSGKEDAIIEIGMILKNHECIYYIKDNGAGFDMQYADKLFGVFQRLHTEDEFAGTGVGLALVQRIITRHEGTIWAEAEVNKGASFYFTLPGE